MLIRINLPSFDIHIFPTPLYRYIYNIIDYHLRNISATSNFLVFITPQATKSMFKMFDHVFHFFASFLLLRTTCSFVYINMSTVYFKL